MKAILRSTIAKAEGEKQAKEGKKEEGLKTALKEAVGKEGRELPPIPEPPVRTPPPPSPKPETGAPAPFEVSEETLRSIFKDA